MVMNDLLTWLMPWWRDVVPWAPLIALLWLMVMFRPVRYAVIWVISSVLILRWLLSDDDA
jgi:hypothetical protein